MTKTMYKVVRWCNLHNSYVSARSTFVVLYKIGDKAVPKVGKIFVFEKLSNAINFRDPHETIFVGQAENPRRIRKIAPFFHQNVEGQIKMFWETRSRKKRFPIDIWCSPNAPKGSFVADSFTPTDFAR